MLKYRIYYIAMCVCVCVCECVSQQYEIFVIKKLNTVNVHIAGLEPLNMEKYPSQYLVELI